MDEFDNLQAELDHYRAEKAKIRDLIGQIGGKTQKKRNAIINAVFLVMVASFFVFDIGRHILGWSIPLLPPMLLLEIAVLLVSLKIIWMIHLQSKVDHFQFWILNTIEFRIGQIAYRMDGLEKAVKGKTGDADQD